jgi:hypothetical protein
VQFCHYGDTRSSAMAEGSIKPGIMIATLSSKTKKNDACESASVPASPVIRVCEPTGEPCPIAYCPRRLRIGDKTVYGEFQSDNRDREEQTRE